MDRFVYKPEGVCSSEIRFSLDEDGILHDVRFTDGCPGNLLAISKLVEGRRGQEVSELLKRNTCGMNRTSCADQLAAAIEKALQGKGIES